MKEKIMKFWGYGLMILASGDSVFMMLQIFWFIGKEQGLLSLVGYIFFLPFTFPLTVYASIQYHGLVNPMTIEIASILIAFFSGRWILKKAGD